MYCIGIFTLMFLSLLQTILMMYLMEIETESRDKEMDIIQSLVEGCDDGLGRDYNAQSCEEGETYTLEGITCVFYVVTPK